MLNDFVEAVRSWRRKRACLRELSQLSDHELAELGMLRSDIATIVRETPGL
jgi:uncharacterized protein YjiS (DUF1127 family)